MPLSKNGTLCLRQIFAHQPYLILLKSLSSIILLVMNSSTAMRGNSDNIIVFFFVVVTLHGTTRIGRLHVSPGLTVTQWSYAKIVLVFTNLHTVFVVRRIRIVSLSRVFIQHCDHRRH